VKALELMAQENYVGIVGINKVIFMQTWQQWLSENNWDNRLRALMV